MVAKYLHALGARGVQQALKGGAVNVLGEERGVPVTPHRFRHTHATGLLNEGSTLPDVQKVLGRIRSARGSGEFLSPRVTRGEQR